MEIDLARLADGLQGLKIVVIGEAILDVYLQGRAGRLCREAPVPVVEVDARDEVPGGAANTAVNAAALGARVTLLSVVGDDREGLALQESLMRHAIPADGLVVEPGRQTLAKHRLIGDAQMLARFDYVCAQPPGRAAEVELTWRLTEAFAGADAVVVSDYLSGLLTPTLIESLRQLQARMPRLLVVDSGRLAAFSAVGATAVTPSYAQALGLLSPQPHQPAARRAEWIASLAEPILDRSGARIAAVTLDSDGAVILERERPPYRTYARPASQARATGGGDTFTAAFALALCGGADAHAAAELAAGAAAVVVGKDGTAACTAHELRSFIAGEEKRASDPATLVERLERARAQGKRIVFTNGCFDILHRGHVTLLNRAKGLGDILVVGINSDQSVQRLKGPGRPINSLEDRIKVLSALSYIDHVIPFDEDTPSNIIRVLRPDVFVKGGDYTRETLPEAPLVESLGGAVRILPYMDDRSTSRIINRIREVAG